MRWFRRSGPSLMRQEGDGMRRYVQGPVITGDPEQDRPGGVIAYDDSDPAQARIAEQLTHEGGWFEVDGPDGEPVTRDSAAPRLPAPAASPPKDESPDDGSSLSEAFTPQTEPEPEDTGDHEEGV